MFAQPDEAPSTAPIPNLERRTASAGFDEHLKEQMSTLKNISVSSLNLVSSKLLQMGIKGLSNSDFSEQFMLEDITQIDSKGLYKSVAIANTDTEDDEQSSNKSDTE